jgi:DNA-binding NtrC family response regulator
MMNQPQPSCIYQSRHVRTCLDWYLDELERQHVIRALEETGGNRKRAAELLGINRRTLYRMAERFGIEL